MRPHTQVSAAAAALLTLATPAFLAPHNPAERGRTAKADVPTTTVVEDDFLTLFPSDDAVQDGFVAGDDDTEPSVDLPGTGTRTVTWGSVALAVGAAGAIVTANSRSRRPRRPRSGARSGPAA